MREETSSVETKLFRKVRARFDGFRARRRLLCSFCAAVDLGALLNQMQIVFGADVGEGAKRFADGG